MRHFPQRLKSARKMRGMSQQALADAMGNVITKQSISKYESGDAKPGSRILNALCGALEVRPDYFDRKKEFALHDISFRKLQRMPRKEQDRVIALSVDFLERYVELEHLLGIHSHISKLKEKFVIRDSKDVERAAQAIRSKWKLGNDPVYNVIELLEDMGVKVLEIKADRDFSGMSTWVDDRIPVIVINRNHEIPVDRLRFTALHELGHLVLNISSVEDKEQERICNAFAGAMLIPEAKMLMEFGEHRRQILLDELKIIKSQYGISIAAQVFRAKNLGIITETYCNTLWRRFARLGWKKVEPPTYVGEERAHRFHQLLLRAYAEEIISGSKAAALNNMKLSEFKKSVDAV